MRRRCIALKNANGGFTHYWPEKIKNEGNDGWSLKCVTKVCLIFMKFRYMINKILNFKNVILKL